MSCKLATELDTISTRAASSSGRNRRIESRNEKPRLKIEHQQLNQRLSQSERDKRKLREENEGLKAKYEQLRSDATDQMRKAEQEQEAWRLKAKELADELAECKDELFNLQPRDEVTDSQVARDWDTLCQQITRWIDDEAEFVGDLATRLELLKEQHQLSPKNQDYWGWDRQRLVNRYKMNQDLDAILRYNIHYPASIQQWRANALSAMLNLPSFKAIQGDSATKVTREAENIFGPLLPRLAPSAMERFHFHITLPAIDLACNLRRSLIHYYFVYDIYEGQRPSIRPGLALQKKGRPVDQAERGKINIVDIDSHKTLKPSQALALMQDGKIGEEIMLIHPALCRRKGDGDEVTLRKSLHLVTLLEPLPIRVRKDKESQK
ncbi:hypothetical protein MMC18_005860 [Xylographa bjoerkii]|nr:hypothetical protein [Xylographa bjoerkii]